MQNNRKRANRPSATYVDVVAGLIFFGNRLLVCQRREDGSYPLKWEFPGGKVEGKESYLEALGRELKEELGIELGAAKEIFRHRHRYPNARVDVRFFYIESYTGQLKNNVFQRIAWVGVGDLAQLDFLEGDIPLIEKMVASNGKWPNS